MKPCKIGAINIGQRPASARKSMTAQNPRPTIGKRKNSGKNEKKNEEEDSFFGGLKVSQNIAPWAQIDDDY